MLLWTSFIFKHCAPSEFAIASCRLLRIKYILIRQLVWNQDILYLLKWSKNKTFFFGLNKKRWNGIVLANTNVYMYKCSTCMYHIFLWMTKDDWFITIVNISGSSARQRWGYDCAAEKWNFGQKMILCWTCLSDGKMKLWVENDPDSVLTIWFECPAKRRNFEKVKVVWT